MSGGGTCASASFANIMVWDGSGFSGAHATKCVTTQTGDGTAPYHLKTTCNALGDGTPTAPDSVEQIVWIHSRTDFSMGAQQATTQAGATRFRWACTRSSMLK